jgi:hypothetical protein
LRITARFWRYLANCGCGERSGRGSTPGIDGIGTRRKQGFDALDQAWTW